MKKRKLARLLMCVLLTVAIFIPSLGAVAESYVPYDSYTYWKDMSGNKRNAVTNRPMYEVETVLTAKDIGVESFDELLDICTDKNGNVYILDSKKGIVVLDSSYHLVREIKEITFNEPLKFVGAKGIYVHSDLTIYISDTENKRVIRCDEFGNYLDLYTLPESPLIPENFDFKPIKTAVDSKGYVYVLSEGAHYGALLYSPNKKFIGFYGANSVVNGISTTVKNIISRMFPNNTKKGNSNRALPFAFKDIVIDNDGFVYTATDGAKKAQIKKLSPGLGNNILHSEDINFLDDNINRTYKGGKIFEQLIVSLDVSDEGFICALESSYGRIYLYDSENRMITAFGGGMGKGHQKGTFITASSLCVKDNDILVTDKGNNTITVFSCNEYGKKVQCLIKQMLEGNHSEIKDDWEWTIKQDRNLQIAYTGLAKAYIADGNYKKAMEIATEGYDRDSYSLAYEYYRNDWLIENFAMIAIIGIISITLILIAVIYIKKRKVFSINYEFGLMVRSVLHPINSFNEIKEKNTGSIKLSLIVLLLSYITAVLKELLGGFMFIDRDLESFNSLWVFVKSVGLIVIWIIANWLVCSLAEGKGKIREIIIVSCYSLIPLIIGKLVWIPLSNFLIQTEESFLNIVSALSLIWALVVFVIGLLCIHEFSFTRFIGTTCLSVIGMAAIIILIILLMILLQQLGGFLLTIVMEMFL